MALRGCFQDQMNTGFGVFRISPSTSHERASAGHREALAQQCKPVSAMQCVLQVSQCEGRKISALQLCLKIPSTAQWSSSAWQVPSSSVLVRVGSDSPSLPLLSCAPSLQHCQLFPGSSIHEEQPPADPKEGLRCALIHKWQHQHVKNALWAMRMVLENGFL